MPDCVTDTHALVWYLTADKRLSPAARAVFEDADNGRCVVWIPGIVLIEAVYFVEKARYPTTLIVKMLDLIDPPSDNYALAPLDTSTIRVLQTIDRSAVPEMPDRIISATAISLGLPLISKDAAITALSELSIVW